MSLLGKKRTKRSEEDDKEYEKLAGIKDEEENSKEENEKKENIQNNISEENAEIKIVENTINIPTSERIKNTTIKKETKKIKIDIEKDTQKINLYPKEIKDNNNDIIKDNKEIKDIKEKNNKEEVVKNPFDILVKKEEEEKEKDNNKINNKETSLFSNVINKNKDTNKSLFDGVDASESLFGNINNINNNANDNKDNKEKKESNQHSLFGNISLFSNNAGKSLFDNNNNNNNNNSNTLLFSNVIKNPFSDIKGDIFAKGLFDNNANKNEKNNNNININEKGNSSLFEGDDNISEKSDEGDKPKTKYVTEPLKAQDYSEYSKLFNLNINNLFLFNKKEKKYISKGSGFFSIEKTKDEKSEKHQAVVVFRNHAGNKLVEGFMDVKFNKCDIISKDFNYVVCFGIIMMNENKPDIGFIKIPFKNEDNAKELKKSFDKALEFIQNK